MSWLLAVFRLILELPMRYPNSCSKKKFEKNSKKLYLDTPSPRCNYDKKIFEGRPSAKSY